MTARAISGRLALSDDRRASPFEAVYPEVGAGGFSHVDGTVEFYPRVKRAPAPNRRCPRLRCRPRSGGRRRRGVPAAPRDGSRPGCRGDRARCRSRGPRESDRGSSPRIRGGRALSASGSLDRCRRLRLHLRARHGRSMGGARNRPRLAARRVVVCTNAERSRVHRLARDWFRTVSTRGSSGASSRTAHATSTTCSRPSTARTPSGRFVPSSRGIATALI